MYQENKDKITSESNYSRFNGVKRQNVRANNPPLIKSLIFASGLRLSFTVLATFLFLISLSSVGSTTSLFYDSEQSISNYFRADPISFSVSPEDSQIDISSARSLELIMKPDPNSDPIQYFVSVKKLVGDDSFCNSIKAFGTWPFPTDTNFVGFVSEATNTTGSWTVEFSVPDDKKIPNSSCIIEITYFGWNDNLPLSRSYTDTQKVQVTFFIPSDFSQRVSAPLPQGVVEAQTSIQIDDPNEDNSDNEDSSVKNPIVNSSKEGSDGVEEKKEKEDVKDSEENGDAKEEIKEKISEEPNNKKVEQSSSEVPKVEEKVQENKENSGTDNETEEPQINDPPTENLGL